MERSRRATTKRVDYSKEQEFSDAEDIFDESDVETTPAPKKGRGGRKSSGVRLDDDVGFDGGRTVYTEKGYDPMLAPIRERFPFLPEYEEDGSPRIDLIVGRRAVDEKEDAHEGEPEDSGSRASRSKVKVNRKDGAAESYLVEYEYLVKYKGKSYLHLEWKTGADLESMNKSAKGIYRRYLKKVNQGQDDELENPEFDPSYAIPEKILDEADQEVAVELTDKELLKWEKEREEKLANESDDEDEKKKDEPSPPSEAPETYAGTDTMEVDDIDIEWPDGDIDFKTLSLDKLRAILRKETPYYPVVEGCDNPYRDGYATEPPKKPRASYLFFQATMRSYFQKRNPKATQAQLMTIIGDHWRTMNEEDKVAFAELSKEEAEQYEKEKVLLTKAERPNEVWQPIRRCKMVLERLEKDSFADIFLEPVDLEDFPDYEEIIDFPMDLSTVKKNLGIKKYQAPEQFARDMRKIWNNCKIYNQHGTAIWHVADYMSKQFERLYHAWVLEFRERYLRWAEPRARPWASTCRISDGKCKAADNEMVMCDHCDAMYGIKCLDPPLETIPTKAWHCRDCKPKLKSAKGMHSALAEQAARKRAELGDIPTKKVNQTMYLVKWQGLGYEFCTWETKKDVNDDSLIAEFHKLNSSFADEVDMPVEVVDKVLESAKHVTVESAGGNEPLPEFQAQLYAQTRLFQFSKFAVDELPDLVKSSCGTKTKAFVEGGEATHQRPDAPTSSEEKPAEIKKETIYVEKLNLPDVMTGEYDVVLPVTPKGLLMNVGEMNGNVAFLGYRKFPDGSAGPAEKQRLLRNIGDRIIAVNGKATVGRPFKDVIDMLRESGTRSEAHMRFLEAKFSACDIQCTSMGIKGRYTVDIVQRRLREERQRSVIDRHEELGEVEEEQPEEEEKDDSSAEPNESDNESDEEGEFKPDSDDEEMRIAGKTLSPSQKSPQKAASPAKKGSTPEKPKENGVLVKEETTRSLGLRLLREDLGYSSDEGGEEDCAYFLDGVDASFVTEVVKKKTKGRKEEKTLHVRQNEFTSLGDKAKLVAAVALSQVLPSTETFDAVAVQGEKKETPDSPEKLVKRSTVKVEQLSVSTGETIHVWANVEAASATLQLPLNALRQVLMEDYDEDVGDEVGGYKWRYALAGAKVTAGTQSTSRGGKKAKEAWLEFRDKLYDPAEPHIYKNENRLRDYQVDGVNWLSSTWYKKQGCVLADEMGLGKIVCYIEHLFRVEKIRRPYLVVVPLSTIEHWRREFAAWTDLVCCIYHDRQRVWRDVLREYEWYYEDKPHTSDYLKFDVLVTTYDTLIGDFDVVSQIPFRVAVVDEAHRLRNQKGRLLECMREISAKGTMHYGFQSRVLMSGTPLQNDLNELWTLLNFIEPFKFPDVADFQAKFGNMANKEQVESLQQMISPYMLRRVKEDVAKDIPAKEETVIDVELTSIQKQYYRAIFEHNHAFLNMGASRQPAPKLMNIQMELRKVCNHPFLLEGVEHREMDRAYNEFSEKDAFRDKTPEQRQLMLNERGYIMSSGKMVLLDKLLPKLRQEGHKILVFSQMVKMLDLISDYCEFRDFKYERLDGRVRGTERQKAIDRFEREDDSFLFLLSTRAGGVGINLTAADICIIFDSDWNPQNDVQAQARCHRIGQTKDVRIYRLITSRSFEQEMFDRASRKLGLEQAVLGTFEKEKDDNPTQQEMEQLLKRGAYALLEDENDDITKEFCADDIESILAKRTRTRVVEGAKTASWLNKQGMVVSKSKFSAESGDGLDMDDPQFWQKVMPDFVTPSIMLQKLEDLQHIVDGTVKGPGRGRKRKSAATNLAKEDEEMEEAEAGDDAMDVDDKEAGAEKEDEAKADEKETEESKTDAPTGDSEAVGADAADDEAYQDNADEGDDNDDDEEMDNDDDGSAKKKTAKSLSRANKGKVHKYIGELKSMMEGIFEQLEDETLPADEKDVLQKLLLTISVKEIMFNDDQRQLARSFLKKVEGDRRRRCRTTDQNKGDPTDEAASPEVNSALKIVGKKRKKRTKKAADEQAVDEDGYLRHSDSEGDWSDVGEDIYGGTGAKSTMSAKEAKRRRQWCAGDDEATAAGRPWPVFPRPVVKKVLSSLLEAMIKYDKEKGGMFSEPVSKEEFPEYYEQIKTPMDYSSMLQKLENGEYRSAQAMQKDFVLILKNCLEFNDKTSEIVTEARSQHLMRPKMLREAALKHDLFLGEDGSVIEIVDEKKKKSSKDKNPKRKKDENGTAKKKGTKRKRSLGADEEPETKKAKAEPIPFDPRLFDVSFLKKEREAVANNFDAARAHVTRFGAWEMPKEAESKFKEVALATLVKMSRYDRYEVFAEAVSEEEAPGYAEVVKHPMDFGKMKDKVEHGAYGEGSAAAGALFRDFLLVFDNCFLYNPEGSDVAEEAARVLTLLPEAFASACAAAIEKMNSIP